MSLTVTVMFLLNSTAYGIELYTKTYLRVPVGDPVVIQRIKEIQTEKRKRELFNRVISRIQNSQDLEDSKDVPGNVVLEAMKIKKISEIGIHFIRDYRVAEVEHDGFLKTNSYEGKFWVYLFPGRSFNKISLGKFAVVFSTKGVVLSDMSTDDYEKRQGVLNIETSLDRKVVERKSWFSQKILDIEPPVTLRELIRTRDEQAGFKNRELFVFGLRLWKSIIFSEAIAGLDDTEKIIDFFSSGPKKQEEPASKSSLEDSALSNASGRAKDALSEITETTPSPEATTTETAVSGLELEVTTQPNNNAYLEAVRKVVTRLNVIGNLSKAEKMSFFDLADSVGAIEIKDPHYADLAPEFIFYVSQAEYERIEIGRKEFMLKHKINEPLTSEKLLLTIPNLNYVHPDNRRFPEQASIHPEITGPGIYYHRGNYKRAIAIDPAYELKKFTIILHELLEQEFSDQKVVDEAFDKYFHHAHPYVLLGELLFAALIDKPHLDETIRIIRQQIDSVKLKLKTHPFKVPIHESPENTMRDPIINNRFLSITREEVVHINKMAALQNEILDKLYSKNTVYREEYDRVEMDRQHVLKIISYLEQTISMASSGDFIKDVRSAIFEGKRFSFDQILLPESQELQLESDRDATLSSEAIGATISMPDNSLGTSL